MSFNENRHLYVVFLMLVRSSHIALALENYNHQQNLKLAEASECIDERAVEYEWILVVRWEDITDWILNIVTESKRFKVHTA